MRYSERLGELSDAQLQAALDRFELGKLLSARPAPGGLFGQNVMLESSAGAFVLRGDPHADWQLPKERFLSKLVQEQSTAPVPWPYTIEQSAEIFGWPFAIMPTVAGTSGEQAFGGNHRAALDPAFAHAAGVALGRLHQTRVPFAGLYDLVSDSLQPHAGAYSEHVEATIATLIERTRAASSATTAADIAWVATVVQRARPAMNESFEPTVIHLDYAPGNIIGEATSPGWHITAIVDWMTAEAGDGEADLARFLTLCLGHPAALDAFLAGYHSVQPRRPGFELRSRVYLLMDRLWLWEYGQRNHIWFAEGTTLREWAEPFVEMLSGS